MIRWDTNGNRVAVFDNGDEVIIGTVSVTRVKQNE